ncbi:hypothetical protein LTS08_006734 [Lithohypha guttulata]|nr:hypothetical protein LTS08_006734 [Lithohypha guttulata]
MSFGSFLDHLPADDTNNTNGSTNRKRSGATYNGFSAAKRQQTQGPNINDVDSLFVSEGEEDPDLQPEPVFEDENLGDMLHAIDLEMEPHPRSQMPAPTGNVTQNRSQTSTKRTNTVTSHPGTTSSSAHRSTVLRPTNGNSTSHFKATNPSSSSAPSAAKAQRRNEPIEIKDEADEASIPQDMQTVPERDRIKIYVGRKNKQCFVGRPNLLKSPVLTSWITEEEPGQSPYIMRPQLLKTDFTDFDAVCQYLHSGEYAPLLLETRPGSAAWILDGKDGEDIDAEYSRQLIRAGRIHVIAQMFKIEGLDDLVFRKVTMVDTKKYSLHSLVKVAEVVFSGQAASKATTAEGQINGDNGTAAAPDTTDKLEEWIVGQVASNLQEITKTRSEEFWPMVNKTKKTMFYARVLEEAADQYRATGGMLPEAIVELE